ncbi:phosphopyruvate hydratase [Ureaplasma ceti]|uniref:Enolase n=1 Tax=Ureaplasma ceti TaxID=3119530 RepID=A0ABP9UDF8_9BACT
MFENKLQTVIKQVKAYQIYDSRGYPTVACEVQLTSGHKGLACVPSGASTGEKEAVELRDQQTAWMGKGVNQAVANVNQIIAPKLIGFDPFKQNEIDQLMIELDGTDNKARLGANAILAVSLAVCRAAASACGVELYKYLRTNLYNLTTNAYDAVLPLTNVINGGQHANNNLDFQEFMLVPLKPTSWNETLKITSECFLSLQKILKDNHKSIAKGDEGGFSIDFDNLDEVFELLLQAIQKANYIPGVDVGIALDVAASEFYDNGVYNLHYGNELKKLSSDELIVIYDELLKKYPIISIEDPFDENDWAAYSKFTELYGHKIQVVGDDIYCTNKLLLQKGIDLKASNAILIKLNQIGTLTECLETIKLAHDNGLRTVISHRSGETEDTFIADLAIAVNAQQIKTGSMSRSERLAKYNRITYINELDETLVIPNWEELLK